MGSFIVAPNAHMTPRSVDMPMESGGQEVDRISQFAVQEYLRFTKKEKQVPRLPSALSSLKIFFPHKTSVTLNTDVCCLVQAMVKMSDKLARLLREKQELKLWAEEQVIQCYSPAHAVAVQTC